MRHRTARNAETRDITLDISAGSHSRSPPQTPERQGEQTTPQQTPSPDRDPLTRQDPWEQAVIRRPPQPPPAPVRDMWETYQPIYAGEPERQILGELPPSPFRAEPRPLPERRQPRPQWQQEQPRNYGQPRVYIPGTPPQTVASHACPGKSSRTTASTLVSRLS